jgi:hypothetical protein
LWRRRMGWEKMFSEYEGRNGVREKTFLERRWN